MRTLSNEALLRTLMRDFRSLVRQKTTNHEESVNTAVRSYMRTIRLNFDLVREENALRESEQDPLFHNRVTQAVQDGWERSRRSRNALSI